MTTPGDADTFTLLPGDTGISATRVLGFCIAEGAWHDVAFRTRTKPETTIALGTRLVAVVLQVRFGFVRERSRQCVVAPTATRALASPLCRNPAWRKVVLLPFADPATGALVSTFIARTPGRADLVRQLDVATRRQEARGVDALPVVELSRTACYVDDPGDDGHAPGTFEYFAPTLPIVDWADPNVVTAGGCAMTAGASGCWCRSRADRRPRRRPRRRAEGGRSRRRAHPQQPLRLIVAVMARRMTVRAALAAAREGKKD